MSAVTKTLHTKKKRGRGLYSRSDSVPLREVFKEELEQHGEIGVYLRGLRYRERLTRKELAKKLGRGVAQHHKSRCTIGALSFPSNWHNPINSSRFLNSNSLSLCALKLDGAGCRGVLPPS